MYCRWLSDKPIRYCWSETNRAQIEAPDWSHVSCKGPQINWVNLKPSLSLWRAALEDSTGGSHYTTSIRGPALISSDAAHSSVGRTQSFPCWLGLSWPREALQRFSPAAAAGPNLLWSSCSPGHPRPQFWLWGPAVAHTGAAHPLMAGPPLRGTEEGGDQTTGAGWGKKQREVPNLHQRMNKLGKSLGVTVERLVCISKTDLCMQRKDNELPELIGSLFSSPDILNSLWVWWQRVCGGSRGVEAAR